MNGDCAGDPREENDNDEAVRVGPVKADLNFQALLHAEKDAIAYLGALTEIGAALGLDSVDWRDLPREVRKLAADYREASEPRPCRPLFKAGPSTTVTLETANINAADPAPLAAEPTGYRSPADAHLPPYAPPDAVIQVVAESVGPEPEILLGQTWRRADWIGDGVIETGMERIRIVGSQKLGALWGVVPAHREYDGPSIWIGEKEIRSAFQLVPPEVSDGR